MIAIEVLQYDFMQRALVLAVLVGVTAPLVGIYLVQRGLSLIGDGLGHVALTGVAVGLVTSRSPVITALVAAVLGAVAVELVRVRGRTGGDVALAVLFYGGIAGGVVIASQAPPGTPVNLDAYLFGSAAALTTTDLWMISSVGLAALFVMLLLWRRLEVYTFDPLFAHSLGIPVRRLEAVLRVLLVTGVVVGIHAVGVVLMIALLATPASAARQWTRHLGTMVALSSLFGAVSAALGTVISARYAHLPAGPVIVLVATAVFLVSLACAPRRGLLSRMRRRVRSVEVAGA